MIAAVGRLVPDAAKNLFSSRVAVLTSWKPDWREITEKGSIGEQNVKTSVRTSEGGWQGGWYGSRRGDKPMRGSVVLCCAEVGRGRSGGDDSKRRPPKMRSRLSNERAQVVHDGRSPKIAGVSWNKRPAGGSRARKGTTPGLTAASDPSVALVGGWSARKALM
jgi:hypothetical protein